jgi:hypothetical protein
MSARTMPELVSHTGISICGAATLIAWVFPQQLHVAWYASSANNPAVLAQLTWS